MKKSTVWDVGNESAPKWEEGQAPCFKLWPTKGKMTALLDADMFSYIVGFLASSEAYTEVIARAPDKYIPLKRRWFKWLHRQPECQDVINHCDSLINAWTVGAGCDSAIPFITMGSRNFRYDIAMSKEYKGVRNKKPKPPFHDLIKWHIINKHKAIVSFIEEADDLMGSYQYQMNEGLAAEGAKQGSTTARNFSRTVIVTKDKDLRMIAGWHSNPDVHKGELFWSSRLGYLEPLYYDEGHRYEGRMKKLEGSGMMFFYAQCLMGDSVDNYGGLPLCGMVATYKALQDCKSIKQLHKLVEAKYKAKFGSKHFTLKCWTNKKVKVGWKDMLVEQGRLAWMQTHEGEVWQPKHILPSTLKWKKKSDRRGMICHEVK